MNPLMNIECKIDTKDNHRTLKTERGEKEITSKIA
jgi:hypothetical protein